MEVLWSCATGVLGAGPTECPSYGGQYLMVGPSLLEPGG